jgi:predicted molibdopterin-dependent oxidoreductase YjgC
MQQGTRRIGRHPVLGERRERAVVRFEVDGRSLTALDGETIATALHANDVSVLRTMPETGSPRGRYCGVGRCPDCMMTVDGVLNVRACVTLVQDGMRVETQQGLGTWTAER